MRPSRRTLTRVASAAVASLVIVAPISTVSNAEAISYDGGQTWGPFRHNWDLTDPRNNASIVRAYPDAPEGSARARVLLFSNADSSSARVPSLDERRRRSSGELTLAKTLSSVTAPFGTKEPWPRPMLGTRPGLEAIRNGARDQRAALPSV